MKISSRSLFVAMPMLVAVALPLSAHAETQLKPGLWEYKMTMQMAGMPSIPGMPGLGGAPMSVRRCLTAEDAENPQRALEVSNSKQQCVQEDFKTEGNKVSFKVRCTGEPAGTGNGEFTIAEDHLEGTMKIRMANSPLGNMEMSQIVSGKRLGDCTK